MSEVKVFRDITSSIFACVKASPNLRAKYVPADADKGSASIAIGGHVMGGDNQYDLNFEFDPAAGDLSYTLVKKSAYLPVSELCSLLERTIAARASASSCHPQRRSARLGAGQINLANDLQQFGRFNPRLVGALRRRSA